MPTTAGAAANLAAATCEPCRGGIPPMERPAAERLLGKIPGWSIADAPDRLVRRFTFDTFAAAQRFAVGVGDLCEDQGHHAEITYGWGYCVVSFWTHKIKGLHENDFIMAAKVDALAAGA